MSDPLLETMADSLQAEFKKEVQRRQDIIRGLASQEDNLKKSVVNANAQLDKINGDIEDRQKVLDVLDFQIKDKNDQFEKHVSSVQDSFEKKEESINETEKKLEEDKKSHDSNVLLLNEKFNHVEMCKSSLIEELKSMQLGMADKITEAIEDISRI